MKREIIYEVLNGDRDAVEARIQDGVVAINAFDEGSECNRLYEEVYRAKLSLNQRLGTEEDPEIETIIDNMSRIMRIIALQMYEYGSENERDKIS